MSLFPIFLKLAGRPCVVVGAGNIAESKIEGLLQAEASVTVIAPEALPRVREWAESGQLVWQQRGYRHGDLAGAFLVVAGTATAAVNRAVYAEANAANILCNAVDDPPFHRSPRRTADSHLDRRRKSRAGATSAQGDQRAASARHR
jgi:precorrin-2 dehydrogenase/sirohydrochlorin ferrochelatase